MIADILAKKITRGFFFGLTAIVSLVVLAGCIPFRVPRTPDASGIVLNSATRQPVIGARIYFLGSTDAAVLSGPDGYFKIVPKYERVWLLPLPYDFAAVSGTMIIEARGYDTLQFDQKRDRWPGWSGDKRGGNLWLLKPHAAEPPSPSRAGSQ